ncbi:MAG TPA: DnrO protein [Dokdonella sp.]|nr:DnrO protein [Dokdonella sp.]
MSKPCLAPVLIATLAFAASVQGAPPAHDHEHHDHKTNAPAPAADAQSVRWTADADLRKGMADVHAALDDLRHHEMGHMPANMAAERAGKIEDAVAYIITRCKLPADADAALHKIIIPLQSAAQRLKKDPADMAAIAAMRDAVADYPRQFDDPLWSSAASD